MNQDCHIGWSEEVHAFYYADRYDESEFDVVQYPPEPYPWIFGGRFPESAERTHEGKVVAACVDWLEAHGESSAQAVLDIVRWKSWSNSPRVYRRNINAEIAARKARKAKARNPANDFQTVDE